MQVNAKRTTKEYRWSSRFYYYNYLVARYTNIYSRGIELDHCFPLETIARRQSKQEASIKTDEMSAKSILFFQLATVQFTR